jgi:hypothetical protein
MNVGRGTPAQSVRETLCGRIRRSHQASRSYRRAPARGRRTVGSDRLNGSLLRSGLRAGHRHGDQLGALRLRPAPLWNTVVDATVSDEGRWE